MAIKGIEIYYDIASIPGVDPTDYFSPVALSFRNAAMELIESALEDAGQGEWHGAEIGMGEVNFGFIVTDHDEAERIVRETVAGTEFAGIREIMRGEFPDAE